MTDSSTPTVEVEDKEVTTNYSQRPPKTFPIIEIFGPTIQGEGAMIGVKTMFVRTGGCDYRCTKCDSLHAVIPEAVKANATWMDAQSIADQLLRSHEETGVEWVTISGGNPVMWDLHELVNLLHKGGMKVAVETQGTLWREWVGEVDQLTISPKGPGMGEKFDPIKFARVLEAIEGNYNRMMSRLAVAIKVVVFSQTDLEFAVEIDQILDARNGAGPGYYWPKHDRYLSIGNSYPPVLLENMKLDESEPLGEQGIPLEIQLLDDYRNILEQDYLHDKRLTHWIILPQLHVLIWRNTGAK